MSTSRYFIAAGTARYAHLSEEQQLPLVAQHVEKMVALFVGRLGYELVLPELCDDPTDQLLRTSLGDWCTDPARRESDIVVFYYSGHGAYSGDRAHFLLTANSKERNLEGTAVKTDQLARLMLADTPLKHLLVILDTCHAGMGAHDIARTAISLDAGGTKDFDLIAATAPKDFTFEERFVTAFTAALDDEKYGGSRQRWLDPRSIVDAINEQWRESGVQQQARFMSSGGSLPEFIPNLRYGGSPAAVPGAAVPAASTARDEVEAHWDPRARGVQRAYEEGSYFTGRVVALRELAAWLSAPAHDGRIRIITGAPGAGKSAVLARLVTLSDAGLRANAQLVGVVPETLPPVGAITAAVHAKGKTVADVAARIAASIGVAATTGDELRRELQAHDRPIAVVVDALDEAADPKGVAEKVLAALGGLPHVKLLVGTRAEYISRLGEKRVVIDLDSPAYWDEADLAEYVRRQLLDERTASPYRGHLDLAGVVATAVARRASPLFLVARLTAQSLVNAAVVDVRQQDWSVRFPVSVGDAFDDFLHRFGEEEGRVRELLEPLAYAEGAGLPWENIWAPLASALAGERYYTNEDVRWLRSRAAAFIVAEAVEEGRSVYRLFHQSLAEHLRRPVEEEATVQLAFVRVLTTLAPAIGEDGKSDWLGAPAYVRRHLAAHAAKAGDRSLDRLVADPGFALAADAERLLQVLPRVVSAEAREAARVYRQAAHHLRNRAPAEAAAYVGMIAEQHGLRELSAAISTLPVRRPWEARWALWGRTTPHHTLTQGSEVNEVVMAEVDGHAAIVVRSAHDPALVVRDLLSGAAIGEPISPRDTGFGTLPLAVHPSGRLILMVDSRAGGGLALRAFDLSTREPASPIVVGVDTVPRVMTLAAANGRDVAAAWFEDGTLRAWDLETAAPLLDSVRIAEGNVTRLGIVGAGEQAVVACAGAGWARGWKLHNGQPAGPLVVRDGSLAETIAFGSLGDRVVAVAGDASAVVTVMDLVTGERLPQQFKCNEGSINAVAVAVVHGRQLVAASAGNWNCAVRVWDLESGEVVAGPLAGHTDYTRTIALGTVHGRPVLVSGSQDATVRVWELDAGGAQAREPAGFTGAVAVPLGGRSVVLAGSVDGATHVLNGETGNDAAPALRGHTKGVAAVAVVMLDGGTVVVTSGWDETVRTWQLETGAPSGGPWRGHGHWVRGLDTGACAGTPVAVSGGNDGTIRVWELATGDQLVPPIAAHPKGVERVRVTRLDGLEAVASLGADGTLAVWDLCTGTSLRRPLEITGGRIESFAIATIGGRPTAFLGLSDGGLRRCYLDTPELTADSFSDGLQPYGATTKAVAILTVGARSVVASGGEDSRVRLYMVDGAPLGEIFVDANIYSLTPAGADELIVACSKGLMLLNLRPVQ